VDFFHTNTTNDIVNVASVVVPMFGHFHNAAKSLQEAVETKVGYTWDRRTVNAKRSAMSSKRQTHSFLNAPVFGTQRLFAGSIPGSGGHDSHFS
jgi:hypothetical protein